MDTEEILALVFVLLVLALGTAFICLRCWKAILQEMKDSASGPEPQSLPTTFRNVLRDSFRSSMRSAGNLRRSFRSSFRRRPASATAARRPQLGTTPPVTQVATVDELKQGKSELHPSFMRKPPPEGEERISSQLEPVTPSTSGIVVRTPGVGQLGAEDGALGVYNPLYHHVEQESHPKSTEGSVAMQTKPEPVSQPSAKQQFKDRSVGYDQPVDQDYSDSLEKTIAAALPEGSGNTDVLPEDDAMAAFHVQHDGSTEAKKSHYLETDTYI